MLVFVWVGVFMTRTAFSMKAFVKEVFPGGFVKGILSHVGFYMSRKNFQFSYVSQSTLRKFPLTRLSLG